MQNYRLIMVPLWSATRKITSSKLRDQDHSHCTCNRSRRESR